MRAWNRSVSFGFSALLVAGCASESMTGDQVDTQPASAVEAPAGAVARTPSPGLTVDPPDTCTQDEIAACLAPDPIACEDGNPPVPGYASDCCRYYSCPTVSQAPARAAALFAGGGWAAGETAVSHLTPAQQLRRLGAREPASSADLPRSESSAGPARLAGLPSSLDWRSYNGRNYISPIRNQGNCGSCWAFPPVAGIEARLLMTEDRPGSFVNLSEQLVLSCSGGGNCESGGWHTTASQFLSNAGIGGENYYKYIAQDGACGNAIAGWQSVAAKVPWNLLSFGANRDVLRSGLNTYGPLAVQMGVFSDFFSYTGGVYAHAAASARLSGTAQNPPGYVGNHIVLVVGYDDAGQYFIVKNSWGAWWGEQGFFKIAYSEVSGVVNFGAYAIGYGTPVQTATPDFRANAVSTPPATAAPGDAFTVWDSVTSVEGYPTTVSTRYYLSTTNTKSQATLLRGARLVPVLDGGASSDGTTVATLPVTLPQGQYYLLACADDTEVTVRDTASRNRCAASSAKVTVARSATADLAVTALSEPPANAALGQALSVTATTANIGGQGAAASVTRYYLSPYAYFDSRARLLSGVHNVPALNAGATSAGTEQVILSGNVASGAQYLLACADDTKAITEGSEANNCRASQNTVAITGPDLVVISVSSPPASKEVGGSFSVSGSVKNQGTGPSAASLVTHYLSLTASLSGAKLASGTRQVPALATGATSSGSATVIIPPSLPAGNYYLIACADGTSLVAESSEGNNCRASSTTMAIVAKPDYVVAAVSKPPATVHRGAQFSVADTTKNQGGADALASSVTRFFLSPTVNRADGTLLGLSRTVPALAKGASSVGTTSLTVPSSLAVRSYYLIACADAANTLAEGDEANNCTVAASMVAVQP